MVGHAQAYQAPTLGEYHPDEVVMTKTPIARVLGKNSPLFLANRVEGAGGILNGKFPINAKFFPNIFFKCIFRKSPSNICSCNDGYFTIKYLIASLSNSTTLSEIGFLIKN